jgi:hypothetical protein
MDATTLSVFLVAAPKQCATAFKLPDCNGGEDNLSKLGVMDIEESEDGDGGPCVQIYDHFPFQSIHSVKFDVCHPLGFNS